MKLQPLRIIFEAVNQATGPIRALHREIKSLSTPLKSVTDATGRVDARFSGVVRQVRNIGLAAAGAAAGVGALVLRFADSGDQIATTAGRLGLAARAYQEISFAANRLDVDQEELDTSLAQFVKRLGEAKAGKGALAAFLKDVNPGFLAAVQGARSVDEALDLMLEGMGALTDPTKRAALATAAFGRSGLAMVSLLQEGPDRLRELREAAERLGGVMSEDMLRAASDFDNAWKDIKTVATGVRNAFAGALLPELTKAARALTEEFASNRQAIVDHLAGVGRAAGQYIPELIAWLYRAGLAVGGLVEALGGVSGVAQLVAGILGARLAVSIAGLIASVIGLGAALVKLGIAGVVAFAKVAAASLPLVFSMLTILGPVALVAVALAGLVAIGKHLYERFEPVRRLFDAIAERLKPIVDGVKKLGESVLGGVVGKLGGFVAGVKERVAPVAGAVRGLGAVGLPPGFAAAAAGPRGLSLAPASGPASGGGRWEGRVRIEIEDRRTRVTGLGSSSADVELVVDRSLDTGPSRAGR